jgi:hypothetical protein
VAKQENGKTQAPQDVEENSLAEKTQVVQAS